ncbi:MAG: TonB-system energizer ExbB [Succinivibrionaceae bacterium]|nr:TonB-system energizer ExbB [Succinivibrionaceae bacterium]
MEYTKNVVDLVIFSILGLMGFIALWFTVERIIFLRRFNSEAYRERSEMETSLTNNMTVLFIIYSNAPYVGLLGTVAGIMLTFYEMGMSGGLNASDIMVGMSLALKATALGLIVAIPTLISYNALTRKISVISSCWKDPITGSGS